MADTDTTPRSQDAATRPIAFALHDTAQNTPIQIFPLSIRPEELTRSEPSRMAIGQTLGGAWLDDFGPGVASVNLSGTTGWGAGGLADGHQQFIELHRTVWQSWHELRKQAAAQGKNPDDVHLIFSDELDDFTWRVAPQNFVLRRSRSRPLLHQYQISMTKLGDEAPVKKESTAPADNQLAAITSLSSSIDTINRFGKNANGAVRAALAPFNGAMDLVTKTQSALTAVKSLTGAGLGAVRGVAGPVLEVARNLSTAASNVFHMASAVKGLPLAVKGEFMTVASAFTNAKCLLVNALKPGGVLSDYSGLYGSSNCSSTAGGRPVSAYRNVNVLAELQPAATSAVSMTAQAETSLKALASIDVINAPPAISVGSLISAVNSGLTLSPAAITKAIEVAKGGSNGL